MWLWLLYIFFYFEITKHLGGIFIVFATEVACLFKLFYSELHIYTFHIYIAIRLYAFKKEVDSTLILFSVNEKREQKEVY